MKLNLSSNEIGPQGAEYLANALKQNTVVWIASLYFLFNIVIDYFLQKLTELRMIYDEIDQQGGEHFANALQENQVTW